MYSTYYNSFYNRDRTNRRPGHNYDMDDWHYLYPSWSEYTVGRPRRYPRFYERDDFRILRSRNNRLGRRRRSLPPLPEVVTPPEVVEEKIKKHLKVTKINMHVKANAIDHKTNKFECVFKNNQPVFRRGQMVKCTLTFQRPYNIAKDDAKLMFKIGENPSQPKGTQVVIPLIEKKNVQFKPDEWGACIDSQKDKDLVIKIHLPSTMIIGPWELVVKTFTEGNVDGEGKLEVLNEVYHKDIYVLFNPWCKDDEVYMAKEKELDEYILNDSGVLYRGNSWWPSAYAWNFGQFEGQNLEGSMDLLLKGYGGVPVKEMASPVDVSRMLSRMVNANQDDGLLVGRWSNDYEGGTPPTKWNGSTAILSEYMKTKKPVKFGQCWVFSGLLTTVCRVFGIPCRSVTNFDSAHDTDKSLTIDVMNKDIGGEMTNISGDSIWNFHVWNEAWMCRPDLDDNYNGWQVIDGTPQESSWGWMQCGPCPVAAVKQGLCNMNYDVGFVFAEVNGDRVFWEQGADGKWFKTKVETAAVGAKISTKKPFVDEGYDKRLDLTLTYKHKEGSAEERNAVLTAHRTAGSHRMDDAYAKLEKQDIESKLIPSDGTVVGGDFKVEFLLKNHGKLPRKMAHVRISLTEKPYYSNAIGKPFYKREFDDFELKPNEEKSLKILLKEEEYMQNFDPKDLHSIYIAAAAVAAPEFGKPAQAVYQDRVTQLLMPELTIKDRVTQLLMPELIIKGPKQGTLGDTLAYNVKFKNDLSVPLTNCVMSIESAGFTSLIDMPVVDVPAKGMFEMDFFIQPKKTEEPKRTVDFCFDSKELDDIVGAIDVTITDDLPDETEIDDDDE